MSLQAAVITCSDSGARRLAPDSSGPLAARLLQELGHRVTAPVVVPDDVEAITTALRTAVAAGSRIVVTTGGTGAGPRDVTPEALRLLGIRELPGIGEAIRAASRDQFPAADLSRALGGIIEETVVLALPGSPGGVRDGLAAVGGLLGHAAAVAAGQRGVHGDRRGEATPAPAGAANLISESPISERGVAADVEGPAAGAVVTFAGIVRDHDRGRSVAALTYEAHPDAGTVLARILDEALSRPGVLGAAARHRVGDLVVGELAFAAAVSAAHRGDAFAACAWLVDEVKAALPVWKHQHFIDGTDEWVNCA